jgi:predicted phosphoadenosine phosphosulfate sulfurtransferase
MNVYEAAVNRMRFIFNEFPRIVVSVSGGKDSTCLWHLAIKEAERRNQKVEVFFLDQEAEYQSTVDQIDLMMRNPLVIPRWYQVPIQMTNATSHRQVFLNAWYEGEQWIREKSELAIHSIGGEYPRRFYDFFKWYEGQDKEPTAHLVGLRIFESMNRQRTMCKANGYKHYKWTTASASPGSYRVYPIFDWHFRDVWKYIVDNNLPYNRMYDRMYCRSDINMRTMRVSNLIHEQAFRSLAQLQEFEPDTFDKLSKRLQGVHCAAMYSTDKFLFSAAKLPENFLTWLAYRDYLLATTPSSKRARFKKRFLKQGDDEIVCQHQVKQLLLNDWEGKLHDTHQKRSNIRSIWWDKL